MTPHQAQAEVERLAALARITAAHIAKVQGQIRQAALDHVAAEIYHPRRSTSTHPGHTGWRSRDQAELERITPVLESRRAREIEALQRRLDRQCGAIDAMVRRHRLNLDPRQLVRVDSYGFRIYAEEGFDDDW